MSKFSLSDLEHAFQVYSDILRLVFWLLHLLPAKLNGHGFSFQTNHSEVPHSHRVPESLLKETRNGQKHVLLINVLPLLFLHF